MNLGNVFYICVYVPVSHYTRVVAGLVFVNPDLGLQGEPLLLSVGADCAHSLDSLPEVRVNRGPTHRFQTLQLTRGSYIESLKHTHRFGVSYDI